MLEPDLVSSQILSLMLMFSCHCPVSPPPSQNKSAITKIYTEALVNDSDGEDGPTKAPRAKPANDITQIYTQKIAEAESPKPERAKFSKNNTDTTEIYTAAFNKDGT